jgi:ParB family chromosome partitioning protein
MRFDLVSLRLIERDPGNVRTHFSADSISELADSIKEYGLLENLILREGRNGKYLIVGGERRWRALHELVSRAHIDREKEIPAIIIDGKGTFENLVENLCREDVSPWDLGFRFNELAEAGYTQKDIGARVGKSQGLVSRHSAIARGLHVKSIGTLNKMRSKLTSAELMRVASLKDADGKADEAAQLKLIEKLAGTRVHRKKRKAERTDTGKMVRRLNYIKDEMSIPSHAQPYVNVIVDYLTGKTNNKKIRFPEEL